MSLWDETRGEDGSPNGQVEVGSNVLKTGKRLTGFWKRGDPYMLFDPHDSGRRQDLTDRAVWCPGRVPLVPSTPARREQKARGQGTQDPASWDGSKKQCGQMTNGRERTCLVFGAGKPPRSHGELRRTLIANSLLVKWEEDAQLDSGYFKENEEGIDPVLASL